MLGVLATIGLVRPARAQSAAAEHRLIRAFCADRPARRVAAARAAQGDAAVARAAVLPNPTLAGEHQRSFGGPEDTETIIGLGALYLAGEGSLLDVLTALQAAEASELGRLDVEEARALARLARMRARGSLFDADLDRACGGKGDLR